MQCNVVQYKSMQCIAFRCIPLQSIAFHCRAMQCNTMHYNAMQSFYDCWPVSQSNLPAADWNSLHLVANHQKSHQGLPLLSPLKYLSSFGKYIWQGYLSGEYFLFKTGLIWLPTIRNCIKVSRTFLFSFNNTKKSTLLPGSEFGTNTFHQTPF